MALKLIKQNLEEDNNKLWWGLSAPLLLRGYMIEIKNFIDADLYSVFKLTHENARDSAIDNYNINHTYWATHVINWVNQYKNGKALFKIAFKENNIVGFLIAVPTQWHYSEDIYLELKEVIVDESLSLMDKARIVKQFAEIAEQEARQAGLAGVSAFSIRDNSKSYSNFLCRKLGWTPCSGAKKIFAEES